MVCGSGFFFILYDDVLLLMVVVVDFWFGRAFVIGTVSQRFLISGQKTKESQIMESLNNVKQNALYEWMNEWESVYEWVPYLLNHCRYFRDGFQFYFYLIVLPYCLPYIYIGCVTELCSQIDFTFDGGLTIFQVFVVIGNSENFVSSLDWILAIKNLKKNLRICLQRRIEIVQVNSSLCWIYLLMNFIIFKVQ